jgi:hypothetical protein
MIKRKPTLDTSEQHKRFFETARQLECDENKERFEEKIEADCDTKPLAKTAKNLRSNKDQK